MVKYSGYIYALGEVISFFAVQSMRTTLAKCSYNLLGNGKIIHRLEHVLIE